MKGSEIGNKLKNRLIIRQGDQEQGRLPDYDTYRMGGSEERNYYLTCSTFLFAVGFLFYKNVLISLCMAVLAAPYRRLYEKQRAIRCREELAIQFRDLLYSLSASVSAGRQMGEAFQEGREQLLICYGEDALLYREVDYIVRSMAESREPLNALLRSFADRCRLPEVRQFAQICEICKKTGGDMEHVIGKTASILMERVALKHELLAMTAQKRMEARILTAMPMVMVLLLNVLSPDYLSALYQGFGGRLVMTLALAGIALSGAISTRILEMQL